MRLRPELLRITNEEGGLDLVDLLLEQRLRLSPEEVRGLTRLEAGQEEPELLARLQTAQLLEGPAAEALRQAGWGARLRKPPEPPPPWPGAEGPWELAPTLPDWVSTAWRSPERWRRLAEDRIAGRILLRLDGFMEVEQAAALRQLTDTLPFEQQDGFYARGAVCQLSPDALPDHLPAFVQGPLHTLLGHLLGETLPQRLNTRVWRLGPGDRITTHADGIHYRATVSLGLSEAWTASAGGAIAFGVPGPTGILATSRWLPHAGDLLLFRPTATAWHAVEPVTRGLRHTLTTHYVAPEYPG